MAISVEQETGQGFASGATSHTTSASLTLVPGQLGLVIAMPSISVAPVPVPTVTGAGQTWEYFAATNLTGVRPLMAFLCRGVAGSGQITLNFGTTVELGLTMCVVNGADVDNPIAWMQALGSATNASFITIYQQDPIDAANASFMGIFTGDHTATNISPGVGWNLIGRVQFPSPADYTTASQWRPGSVNLAQMSWLSSFSHGGIVWEMRAAGSAPNRRSYYDIISLASQTNVTAITITTPTYAGADPIFLAVFTARSTGAPNVPTVTGGGVTWTQLDTVLFGAVGSYRLTTFQAQGPLDGTNVSVAVASQTQETHAYQMVAFEGGGRLVQHPSGSAASTTQPTLAFAQPLPGSSQLVWFAADDDIASGDQQITPGAGWVQAHHGTTVVYPRHEQRPHAMQVGSAPPLIFYGMFRWTGDTLANITAQASANWAMAGVEVAGQNPRITTTHRRTVRRR